MPDCASEWAGYPDVYEFSQDVGLKPEHMVSALELERVFHAMVLAEPSGEKRRQLYQDIYTRVFEIYGFTSKLDLQQDTTAKLPIVETFEPELVGARILDVGCGQGQFLVACAKTVKPTRLLGIDAFAENVTVPEFNLEIRQADIVELELAEEFDAVMSDNVVEHLAPVDLRTHLASIRSVLRAGGVLIVLTPNRLFGPWDVTRIIDCRYSGSTPAQGTHVNEMNHVEMIAALRTAGFTRIRSLLPRYRGLRRLRHLRIPAWWMSELERVGPLVRYLQGLDKRRSLQTYEIGLTATA